MDYKKLILNGIKEDIGKDKEPLIKGGKVAWEGSTIMKTENPNVASDIWIKKDHIDPNKFIANFGSSTLYGIRDIYNKVGGIIENTPEEAYKKALEIYKKWEAALKSVGLI